MAKESLGYVKLEWTCPNCHQRNPGPQKTCGTCGAPQPADVKFIQAEREELIKDETEAEKAKKAAPDIHCPYCGTRNPADAAACSQCSGDLKGGQQRAAGQVVGAHVAKPVVELPCPSCGNKNPDTALICAHCGAQLKTTPKPPPQAPAKKGSPWVLIFVGLAVLLCGILGIVFLINLLRTDDITGTVTSVAWRRTVVLEQYGPVERADFRDEIPSGAEIGTCEWRYHHTQADPAPNSDKVCGTPYTVDQGTGFGEVVQDCEYKVNQEYCKYTVTEWAKADEWVQTGQDFNPIWPDTSTLSSDQRLGDRTEEYRILFDAGSDTYTYQTSNFDLFQQCRIGSEWTLSINGLGGVVGIEPAN